MVELHYTQSHDYYHFATASAAPLHTAEYYFSGAVSRVDYEYIA